eukprot:5567385-Ditylum_brightwellii.AAC.1
MLLDSAWLFDCPWSKVLIQVPWLIQMGALWNRGGKGQSRLVIALLESVSPQGRMYILNLSTISASVRA